MDTGVVHGADCYRTRTSNAHLLDVPDGRNTPTSIDLLCAHTLAPTQAPKSRRRRDQPQERARLRTAGVFMASVGVASSYRPLASVALGSRNELEISKLAQIGSKSKVPP